MVLCFVALFVFAVLGIFSAKYRTLAKEAFDCVLRTATLRPCESKLDERLKATLLAKILPHSPSTARFLNKNYQAMSILFTLLFFSSMAYSIYSTYNYAVYGNCNGPQSTGFCAFDLVFGKKPSDIIPIAPGVGPTLGNGSVVLVEVGCYSCPYTRAAQPFLKQFLAKHPEVKLEFRVLPLPNHENSFISAQAAFCAEEKGKFWEMHDELFADKVHSRANLGKMAGKLGMGSTEFFACLDSERSKQRVEQDKQAGIAANIFGTPTFFLNGVILVGPQTSTQFENALAGKATNSTESGGFCPPEIQE